MRTNIVLDDELVAEALMLTGIKTKKDLVTTALRELVRVHKKLDITELRGKIKFAPGYDYKEARRGRSFDLPDRHIDLDQLSSQE